MRDNRVPRALHVTFSAWLDTEHPVDVVTIEVRVPVAEIFGLAVAAETAPWQLHGYYKL